MISKQGLDLKILWISSYSISCHSSSGRIFTAPVSAEEAKIE